jgi:hypothetical protein
MAILPSQLATMVRLVFLHVLFLPYAIAPGSDKPTVSCTECAARELVAAVLGRAFMEYNQQLRFDAAMNTTPNYSVTVNYDGLNTITWKGNVDETMEIMPPFIDPSGDGDINEAVEIMPPIIAPFGDGIGAAANADVATPSNNVDPDPDDFNVTAYSFGYSFDSHNFTVWLRTPGSDAKKK